MNTVEVLREIIKKHSPKSEWSKAPLEGFKRVANTNRNVIGEAFICRYLMSNDIQAERISHDLTTYITILNKYFKVKTASEGKGGYFQFNHIRLDRKYHYLLCLGISPDKIWFKCWSKEMVTEGQAGHLVNMAAGQTVTFKLTKKRTDMLPIKSLPDWVHTNILNANKATRGENTAPNSASLDTSGSRTSSC